MDSELPPNPPSPPPAASSIPPQLAPPPLIARQFPGDSVKKGGRGWMIAAIILFVVLATVVVGQLIRTLAGVSTKSVCLDGRWLEEVVIENNYSGNKIVVIDLQGLIMDSVDQWTGASLVRFVRDQLDRAAIDDRVVAVVLRVDSPGGEVLASDEIAREITRFQKEHGKPVVASMGSLAASGGYYVAAPCRWIIANELTITGSIGVIMQSYNFRGLLNKVGVTPMTFKSGRYKDMLSWDKEPGEITGEEKALIQKLIDETYAKFQSVVAEGRADAAKANKGEGRALAADWKSFADGRVFSGREAHELGFVDELGNFDTAVARALNLAGQSEANLVQFRMPVSFANFFRMFGEAKTPALKVDLGVEAPKIQAGKMYFLSPNFFH